jgi:hypothetical protein
LALTGFTVGWLKADKETKKRRAREKRKVMNVWLWFVKPSIANEGQFANNPFGVGLELPAQNQQQKRLPSIHNANITA